MVARPAALCHGRGHLVVYGNPAMCQAFGEGCVGLPAREALLGLPAEAFELMDTVLENARPLARWIQRDEEEWRLTVAPRIDPGDGEVYGVALHLRAKSDLPVLGRA
jgi:hypothetical protein